MLQINTMDKPNMPTSTDQVRVLATANHLTRGTIFTSPDLSQNAHDRNPSETNVVTAFKP